MEDKKIDSYLKGISTPHQGEIIKGRIIDITSEGVFVDIGWKSEGLINIEEFIKSDGDINIQIGQEVSVLVKTFSNEKIILSYKEAKKQTLLKDIEDSFRYNVPIDVYVKEKIKAGYNVVYGDEINGFLPYSEVYNKRFNPTGKTLRVKVIKFEKERENFVVSERKFKEIEIKKLKEEFFKNHKIGDIVKAKVKSIIPNGAFVDINGIEGFIHKNNIAWGRIEKISNYIKEGDEINAKLLKLDKQNNKISLGLKHLTPHPWENIHKKYRIGQIVQGKIIEVFPERAFIEIEKGIEGILKKDDFSWKKINNLKNHLKKFALIKSVIKNIDEKNRKIILSLKNFESNPYTKYKNNEIVTGTIVRLERNFCEVEIEKGITGKLFISQASDKKIKSLSEYFKKGDSITSKIIKISPEKGIIELSVKEYIKDREKKEIEKYQSKSDALFTIKDLLEE